MDDRAEKFDELARVLHRVGVETYESMGYNEFSPILIVVPKDTEDALIGNIPGVTSGHAYVAVQRALMAMDVTPQIVALTTDSYGYHLPTDATQEDRDAVIELRKTKSFGQLFEEQDPHVKEALNTVVLAEGLSVTITQTYKYTPADGFEWDEPVMGHEVDWDFDRLINGGPRLDLHGRPLCPVCGHFIPNDATPGEYPGALSRRDNRTEICSDCGTREALEDFARMRGQGL